MTVSAKGLLSTCFTIFACSTVAALSMAATWTSQTSGVTSTLRGVTAASDAVAWASGSGAAMLKTVDGGATWTKQVVADDAVTARLDFRDVDAIDADGGSSTESPQRVSLAE